ncbi:MAG: hypothetical protein ACLFRG_08235 [Desulfococcaceae bacterium]
MAAGALWFVFLAGVSFCWADPPPSAPFAVHGDLYLNGQQIVGAEAFAAYTVVATREDKTHFEPSVVGNFDKGFFTLKIPVQQGGTPREAAARGDKILLHVYWMGYKLLVTEPAEAKVTVGSSGDVFIQDIWAMTGPGQEMGCPDGCYSEDELNAAVEEAIQRWDAGGDGRIGLEEAIHALRVVSGN